jgi:hypothetical protein
MRQLTALPVIVLFVFGCGSDQEQREKLNQVPLTVDPPGGTFEYRPWVTVTKDTLEEGTGNLVVRGPGDGDAVGDAMFDFGCQSPFYIHDEADKRQKRCVEVRRTGELHYYLDTWFGGDSDVRGEYYTINTPRTDTKASITNPAKKIPDSLALAETDTTCRNIGFSEGAQLNVAVTFELPPKLHKQWRTAILEIKVKDASLKSKKALGELTLQPLDPESAEPTALDAVYEGRCKVTVDALEPGKVSRGTYDCADAVKRYATEDDPALLGQAVSIKGDWYCDGYAR